METATERPHECIEKVEQSERKRRNNRERKQRRSWPYGEKWGGWRVAEKRLTGAATLEKRAFGNSSMQQKLIAFVSP